MKKAEIKVGGTYTAKISGRVVPVRVDEIREVSKRKRNNYSGESESGSATVYDVTNLATGRKTTFRSAAKFRGVAGKPQTETEKLGARNAIANRKRRQLSGIVGSPFREHQITEGKEADPSQSTESEIKFCGEKDGAELITPVKAAALLARPGEGIEEALERVERETGKLGTRNETDPTPDICAVCGGYTKRNQPGGCTCREDENCSDPYRGGEPPPNSTPTTDETSAIVEPAKPQEPPATLSDKLGERLTSRPAPKSGLQPTEEQSAILDAVQRGDARLMIEAGAGTGKTSTLKMIGNTLPGNGQYTAFNSSLVAESKGKFQGSAVACNTTHRLAFRAEGKRFANRLNGGRVKAEQVARMLGLDDYTVQIGMSADGKPTTKRLAPGFLASQVQGAIRRFCQSADREVSADHFKYIDGLDMPSADGHRTYDNNQRLREHLLPFARKAWADLSSESGQLPFNHDVYVKIFQLNNPVIAADYILLDEAQDTAPVMLDILKQQKCPVILVGDSAQQIYEWRGACNALAAFPDAPRLFLSQSFRFGEAIAAVANAVLETLDEPTQLRLKGLPSIPSKVEAVEEPTCILCRTNAVAVANLLSAIADGKRPYLIGGGADVIAFVEAAQKLQAGQPTSHPNQ